MSSLKLLEAELRARTQIPYKWKRVQNNVYDRQTDFIYDFLSYDAVVEKINWTFRKRSDKDDLFNYALNRWYNYHSAMAVEKMFCSYPGIEAHKNKKDRLVDFSIQGITFDHKSSVFPKSYSATLEDARQNKKPLIEWFYAHQSQQRRRHMANRLFIVFYDQHGQHWKLKAELQWIEGIIRDYVKSFSKHNLVSLELEGKAVLSDVIFAVR